MNGTGARNAMLLGALVGVGVFVRLLMMLQHLDLRLGAVLFGMCIAYAGVVSASLLLAWAAYKYLDNRRSGILNGPQPGIALALVGTGLAIVSCVVLTVGIDSQVVVIAALSLVVIAVGVWASRRQETFFLPPLALIVAAILLFEIPRELGVVNLNLSSNHQDADWTADRNTNCSRNGSDGPSDIAFYQPAWVIDATELRGDLADSVREQLGQHDPPPDAVRFQVSGEVSVGGLGCYLPIYRFGSTHTNVNLGYTLSMGDDSWNLVCGGQSQIDLDLRVRSIGVGSCYNLRQDAAKKLVEVLVSEANKITGR